MKAPGAFQLIAKLEKRCDELDAAMRVLARHHAELKTAFNQLLANHLEATETTGRVLADVVEVLSLSDSRGQLWRRPAAQSALNRLKAMVEDDEPEPAGGDSGPPGVNAIRACPKCGAEWVTDAANAYPVCLWCDAGPGNDG